MATATSNYQSDILERALKERPDGMTPEAARYFLSLKLAKRDVDRMNELAEKAVAGNLSPSEEAELDEYRRCTRFVDLIKLRAQFALRN